MTTISTHVLDTSAGRPAEGIPVELAQREGTEDAWTVLGSSVTDADGRCKDLPAPDTTRGTTLRLRFATTSRTEFFPEVSIVFTIDPDQAHYHVPLLLNPYGYSVYRGS